MSFEFGSSSKRSRQTPFFKTTGRLTQQGRNLEVDPRLRRPQNVILSELGGLPSGIGRAAGTTQDTFNRLRRSLEGDQGAFIRARTDPIREAFAANLGGLQRNLGMRGLSGSTFGTQAVSNLTTDFNRQMANQTALAMMDTIKAQTGLSEAEISALSQSAAGQAQLSQIINQIIGTEANLLNLGQSRVGSESSAKIGFKIGGSKSPGGGSA